MTKIKNYILILFISIVCSSCIGTLIDFYQGFKLMENFKPYTITFDEPYIYMYIYAPIENGKINRMGIKKNNIDSMDQKIRELYGIMFTSNDRIYASSDTTIFHYIKFYDNLKFLVNGVPKEKIKLSENTASHGSIYYNYDYLPIEAKSKNIQEAIVDIGEIEIIAKDGSIVRKKTKIPPLLFKRVRYRHRVEDWQKNGKFYYRGWAENYHEYDETQEKEE